MMISSSVTPAGSPMSIAAVAGQGSFYRRTQTLLRSAPVHRLADLGSWQRWADRQYDPRVLALAALDIVIARQGMASGTTYDEVVLAIADLARLAEPASPEDEHMAVATYVVDGLLNDRESNDATHFAVNYGDYRGGGYALRKLPFWLLREHARSDGVIVMEASADAINAFRGGLDMDVTDAQAAQVHVLRAQIERGDLPEAEVTAENNLRLTLELDAQIRQLVEATRADVGSVDWTRTVLDRIERARSHVADRTLEEEALLDHLTATDDHLPDPQVAPVADRVRMLIDHCLQRHQALHRRLMEAPTVFLEEQQRQQLRVHLTTTTRIDLRRRLLEPTLRMPQETAADVGESFVTASLGLRPPRLPRLVDLFDRLLAERRVIDEGDVEDEVDLDDVADDIEVLDHEVVREAAEILKMALAEPVHLSTLLEQASSCSLPVQEIVRLSALWAYAPEWDEEDELGNVIADLLPPTVVAVPLDRPLQVGHWRGDDLVLGPARLLIADDENGSGVDIDEIDTDDIDTSNRHGRRTDEEVGG